MALFKKIKAELIDIVQYIDNSHNILANRFERYNNEIKNNAKLIVREGQMAVFINEGQLADIFEPGTYTLSTQNLPVLSTLQGWKYGFNSPFKAEVYFISTKNFLNQKWGTKTPIISHDERFGMLELRAFGNYSFKVRDAQTFLKEIVGSKKTFKTDEITEQLRSIILTRFSDAAAESNLSIEQYASNLNELSALVFHHVHDDFVEYGIEITKFLIENISMPENVKQEIFEISRLNKIDLYKLSQMKTAKAMEAAANNPSGGAGTGMGIGAGLAMGKNMANSMSGQETPKTNAAHTPPPLPNAAEFYAAINGESLGPYNKIQLKELANNKTINQNTLIWKTGTENWLEAKDFQELNDIWPVIPPPIPNL